jgi:hypothetical protein
MESLKLVRDLIAAAEPELTDMARVGAPTCGSPGCIMGWAQSLSPELHEAEFPELYEALGLRPEQGNNLSLGLCCIPEISALDITKDEVLRAIDSVLENPDRTMPAWPTRVRRLLRDGAY